MSGGLLWIPSTSWVVSSIKIGGGGSYCFTSIENIHSTSNQPGAPRAPLKGKTIIHGLYHYLPKNIPTNPFLLRKPLHLILPSHSAIRPVVRGTAAADRGRRADPGDRHGRFVRRAADGRGAAAGRLGGADRHRPAALPRGSPGGAGKSHVGNHGGPISGRKMGEEDEPWWNMMKHDEPQGNWGIFQIWDGFGMIWIGYLPKIGGFDTLPLCTTVCGPHSVLFPHWLLRDGQAFWSLTIDPQIIYEVTKLGLQG